MYRVSVVILRVTLCSYVGLCNIVSGDVFVL